MIPPIKDVASLLVRAVMQTELERNRHAQLDLISENETLGGTPAGFRHGGQMLSRLDLKKINPKTLRKDYPHGSLHPSLVPRANKLLTDLQRIDSDRDRLEQGLTVALKPCMTWQEIRDALPNAVTEYIEQIATLPRTRPEGWTVADNPMASRQFAKICEKIHYYLAARLLY